MHCLLKWTTEYRDDLACERFSCLENIRHWEQWAFLLQFSAFFLLFLHNSKHVQFIAHHRTIWSYFSWFCVRFSFKRFRSKIFFSSFSHFIFSQQNKTIFIRIPKRVQICAQSISILSYFETRIQSGAVTPLPSPSHRRHQQQWKF